MLKIKDNVDLKELEKFGFYETEYYYAKELDTETYILPTSEPICKGTQTVLFLGIIKENKNILFDIEMSWSKDLNPQGYFYRAEKIDLLFDLIQAGLVEKVEE